VPETTFAVRWPDGREQTYYSPSVVVHELLEPGAAYDVGDLVARAGAAMQEASDRVRAKYGMGCTSAMATLEQVQHHAARFAPDETAEVVSA
jgi:uncharacterized repeat protein (TIGR04042 family)